MTYPSWSGPSVDEVTALNRASVRLELSRSMTRNWWSLTAMKSPRACPGCSIRYRQEVAGELLRRARWRLTS